MDKHMFIFLVVILFINSLITTLILIRQRTIMDILLRHYSTFLDFCNTLFDTSEEEDNNEEK